MTANPMQTVTEICGIILGQEGKPLDSSASLFDLGIDSLGFAELVLQLEGSFGDGIITVDDIMDSPSIHAIANKVSGGKLGDHAATKQAAPKIEQAPTAPTSTAPTEIAVSVTPTRVAPFAPTSVLKTPAPPVAPVTPLDAGVNSAVLERLSMLESACKELRSLVIASTPGAEAAAPSLETSAAAAIVSQPAAEAPKPQPKLWIQTTHVGSLPRAPNASDTGKIISQQVDVGIDIINDGEWSRDNYVADMLQRIDGVGLGAGVVMSEGWSCVCEMPCATDMRTVPVYANRFTGANGLITLNPRRVAQANMACHARPTYVLSGAQQVRETVRPLLESLAAAGRSPSDSFWSAPSPGTMAVFCEDRFFQDHVMYVRALAEAMRPEYEAIAATGLQLQIDCPDLAMGRHTRHADLSDEAFLAVAEANVEALNYALENIPMEQVRIHVCWGNYAGPHHHDIAAAEIWPVVAKVKAKFILTEAANPRHAQDAKAFEDACARGLFEAPKVIVPGVIDTTAARVEHPALVAERLLRFVKAVGHPSRVIAGTDCGMATTAKSSAITSDIAWLKLEALVEGAALATKMLLEVSAPVPMPGPKLNPTPFRAAVICDAASAAPSELVAELQRRTSSTDLFGASAGKGVEATAVEAFEKLRWAVDFPLAVVAVGPMAQSAAVRLAALLRQASSGASRRPCELFFAGAAAASPSGVTAVKGSPPAMATAISTAMLANTGFDKRALLHGRNAKPLPEEVDVVVIGAGLLGLMAAARLKKNGHKVAVLEQRSIVGGIWSMYANSTSQVNSSEGGYNIKDLLPEGSPRKAADNRDHSTAAEILKDIAALGDSLADVIYTRVSVAKVLGTNGDYTTVVSDLNGRGGEGVAAVVRSTGVVLAINDRVGLPRPLRVPGMNRFSGVMADGTSDALSGVSWQGKRVVVFGMGAFAVENVRTALESGASHVTVVARRLGTICPKMIDYLNFVKPWDEQYRHDPLTNIKQMKCWRDCYIKSGAVAPEVWPGKVKHDGHTISVSDIWFVAHHLGKMCTKVGTLESMVEGGCVLSDGSFLPADIVVGCIGFTRNTTFCEQLTGRTEVMHSNYLDKNMMYLADAEIDETAFNSFFGSSVLEYAKFYTNTYVQAFERPDALGSILWGAAVKRTPVSLRKWTQYIAVAQELIEKDTTMRGLAADQVRERTKHFYRTMSPEAFLEVNRLEWEELHERLNGSPVSKDKQLPYLFGAAPSWCAPANEVLP
uniref:Carrier domain-containing protein n=1 Tax=Emiliania huxleyi TaxID=2903 RepID=A0A7S3T906_EMIHU